METLENKLELQRTEQIDYAFTLIAINSKAPKFQANFSPLKCKNSDNYIKVIPTYTKQTFNSFSTQLDSLTLKKTQSLQQLTYKQNLEHHLLIAKPSHNYCQICKQRYDDYLQHIEHPFHKRKSQKASSQYSVDSLKQIFDTPRKVKRKGTWDPQRQPNQTSPHSEDSRSLSSNSHEMNSKTESNEKMSITSSTDNREAEEESYEKPVVINKCKEQRRFSNFRTLKNEQSKMEVEQ